jgi:hypothetical protein
MPQSIRALEKQVTPWSTTSLRLAHAMLGSTASLRLTKMINIQ